MLPELPVGVTVRYVAANGRDAKFLHHVFENSPDVVAMSTHEVE